MATTPFPRFIVWRWFLILAAVLLFPLSGIAGSGGESKSADGKPEVTSQYLLGKPLDGYFDRSVFRSTRVVSVLRYEFERIEVNLGTEIAPRKFYLDVALEFGNESGLAECEIHEQRIAQIMRGVCAEQQIRDLLRPGGQRRLKEELAKAVTAGLETARVRQVYFSFFLLHHR